MKLNNKQSSLSFLSQIEELETNLYPSTVENIKDKNYIYNPSFSIFTITDSGKVKAFLLAKLVSIKQYKQFENENISEETLLNSVPNDEDETCLYFASIYSSLPRRTNELTIETLEYFKKQDFKFGFSYAVTKKGDLFSNKHNLILQKEPFFKYFKLFIWPNERLTKEYWQK
ncbi:hypothetical protein [Poseidonibacter lekithochrous]|uniref:hypothetical protein n=1 Tax=Poseidonibacter lekithochrous TaxID=1904463 RepID=UPI000D3DA380|nr:hypothetical protein [Poseidonibacter lekithochrous]